MFKRVPLVCLDHSLLQEPVSCVFVPCLRGGYLGDKSIRELIGSSVISLSAEGRSTFFYIVNA